MTPNELRQAYLEFFKTKGHVIIPSASLVPENDPTTLFTGSGMQPMVPYLLGEKHPLGTRIADSQKSFRTQDIEEVGDNRHTTFFEMLGNWSLGDYFKQEQISWMFEFLTKIVGLDPNKLFITCFRGKEEIGIPKDEEASRLWQKLFNEVGVVAKIVDFPERDGLQDGRIFYYNEKKNWWSRAGVPEQMPLGEPGGPDSEMFWDFGPELKFHESSVWKDEPCHINCDCGRFMEIGNNVFMTYKKVKQGFEMLKSKNVDYGGGLERLSAAANNDPDIFKIDCFSGAKEILESLSGKKYRNDEKETFAFRVILDHLRAATFLIADSAIPSNKDQGYFTRRLIRRSVRFARNLNITRNFCSEVAEVYIAEYKEAYSELLSKKDCILSELEKEETRFNKTLEKGLREFEKMFKNDSKIDGDEAFVLYSTYGFPVELTEELAKERGQLIDREQFAAEFKKHQDLSRSGAEQKFKGGLADSGERSIKYHTATHLLHAALRRVLGDQVEQRGSNITAERLRFDFSYPEKMTEEQKTEVEKIVNEAIRASVLVSLEETTFEEAKKQGAIGLFADKYGEKVKVYTMPGYSKEICGGPHVENTGSLGCFKIIKEEAVSAGIRRIKAILE